MKAKKIIFLAGFLIFNFLLLISAYSDAGKSAFDFLGIPVNAPRAVWPLSQGPSELCGNPSGIHIEKTEIEFSFAKWYERLNLMSAGFGQNLGGSFEGAFFVQSMKLDDIMGGYDAEGIPSGDVKYSNFRYGAGLSFEASRRLRLGGALSIAGEDLDGDKKSAMIYSGGLELAADGGLISGILRVLGADTAAAKTVISLATLNPAGKVNYARDEVAPLSINSLYLKEYIGVFSFAAGVDSSDTDDIRAALGCKIDNVFFNCGYLHPSQGQDQLSAGAEFEFGSFEIALAYVMRGNLGSSLFSTVKYGFDMKGIVKNISESQAEKKKEASEFVKVGTVTDFIENTENGVKQFWLNFTAERKVSGAVVIARDKKLIARARITDTLSEKPLVYEALIEGEAPENNPAAGDSVAVSVKYIKNEKKKEEKEKENKQKMSEKELNNAREILKKAEAGGWDAREQKTLLERAAEFHNVRDYEASSEKLATFKLSIDKLYREKAETLLKDVSALLKDARNVGVNVSYPASLMLKANDFFKKEKYEDALENAAEAKKWLEKTLAEIENEE